MEIQDKMFYNGLSNPAYPAVRRAFFTYKMLGFSNYQMQAVLTAAASIIVFSLSCSATAEAFLRPRECGNYAWYNLILTTCLTCQRRNTAQLN